ncbi:MAG: hypothetical protein EOR51_35060 [Mesorhizobium sp.]|nr:MAG: hypothetical protein EOR51_35060 [Mesorhizobium sp.]
MPPWNLVGLPELWARRFAKPLYAFGTEPCLQPVSAHSGDDRTRGRYAPERRHQYTKLGYRPFTERPEISIVRQLGQYELVMVSR